MKCCDIEIYIKTKQCARTLMKPLTIEAELRDKILDLTGEVYLSLPHKFCPICGKKLERGENA